MLKWIATLIFLIDILFAVLCHGETLTASYYSLASLKAEGTFKTSQGVMANGELFKDDDMVCATRLYPLYSVLKVRCLKTNKSVVVVVKDRIGKRFAKTRIDLSKGAFRQIAPIKWGITKVEVTRIK